MSALNTISKLNQLYSQGMAMHKAALQLNEFKEMAPVRRAKAQEAYIKSNRALFDEGTEAQKRLGSTPEVIQYKNQARANYTASLAIPYTQAIAMTMGGQPNGRVLKESTNATSMILKDQGYSEDVIQRFQRMSVEAGTTAAGLELPRISNEMITRSITKTMANISNKDYDALGEDAEIQKGTALSAKLERVLENATSNFKNLDTQDSKVGPEQRIVWAVNHAVAWEGAELTAQETKLVTERAVGMLDMTQRTKMQGAMASLPAVERNLQEGQAWELGEVLARFQEAGDEVPYEAMTGAIGYNVALSTWGGVVSVPEASAKVNKTLLEFNKNYGSMAPDQQFQSFIGAFVDYGKQSVNTGNASRDMYRMKVLNDIKNAAQTGSLANDFPGLEPQLRAVHQQFNNQHDKITIERNQKIASRNAFGLASTVGVDGTIWSWKSLGARDTNLEAAGMMSDPTIQNVLKDMNVVREDVDGVTVDTANLDFKTLQTYQEAVLSGGDFVNMKIGNTIPDVPIQTGQDFAPQSRIAWAGHVAEVGAKPATGKEKAKLSDFNYEGIPLGDVIKNSPEMASLFKQLKGDPLKTTALANAALSLWYGQVDDNAFNVAAVAESNMIGNLKTYMPAELTTVVGDEVKVGKLDTLFEQGTILEERQRNAVRRLELAESEFARDPGPGNAQFVSASKDVLVDVQGQMRGLGKSLGLYLNTMPSKKAVQHLDETFGAGPTRTVAFIAESRDFIKRMGATIEVQPEGKSIRKMVDLF